MVAVSNKELKELVDVYLRMDKLARAIWISSGGLLAGKEMAEKEQILEKPQKTA